MHIKSRKSCLCSGEMCFLAFVIVILADFGNYHCLSFNGNLVGPGRITCVGPYGPKMAKADDKEQELSIETVFCRFATE